MYNKQLTKNFTTNEMVVSKDFPNLARKIVVTKQQYENLILLLQSTVQPLRDKFGAIRILSGIRSIELNSAVNGSKNSDHLHATALDLEFLNRNTLEAFKHLLYKKELPYRKCIYYPGKDFIHVSGNIPGLSYAHEIYVKTEKGYEIPKKGVNFDV